MFDHIKNTVLNEEVFDPAMEECMEQTVSEHDMLRDMFVDAYEKDYDLNGTSNTIGAIPDEIFDDEEFDAKIEELINSIPEDDDALTEIIKGAGVGW